MNFLFPPLSFVGLESTASLIKAAKIIPSSQGKFSLELFSLNEGSSHVKQLDIHHPILISAIEEKELLLRQIELPLIKKKDIDEALVFQVEPLLPYPSESAILSYQELQRINDTSELLIFSVKKEAIERHLQFWHSHHIEPEKISTVPSALFAFGKTYLKEANNYLLIHLQHSALTIALIKEGKLWLAYTATDGLNRYKTDNSQNSEFPKKLKQEASKIIFALTKECSHIPLEGMVVTGEGCVSYEFIDHLKETFSLPLLMPHDDSEYPKEELLSYAVPIGLALEASLFSKNSLDLRQKEFSYPKPLKRFKQPLLFFCAAICILCLSFWFFSVQYFQDKETELKQNYVDLLSQIGRPYEDFEKLFATKNHTSPLPLNELSREGLEIRLSFLQQELYASPDSFPLFPNVPRVSDVLIWLGQYAAAVASDEKEEKSGTRLQIENFSYSLIKHPQMTKKQEKYQVKIDLEFSSDKPKWAREFHDALIAPNDWIDPKGDIKWSSNRDRYKTSFYLKDKTIYPSSSHD